MRGGLQLVAHKEHSVKKTLSDAPSPKSVAISTDNADSGGGRVGDSVLLGQLLGLSQSRRVHAPVSGIISNIHRDNDRSIVTIENDRKDTRDPNLQRTGDFLSLQPHELRMAIENAGIVGLGGAGFLTSTKLNVAAEKQIKTLIVNGVECEPFITCDDALMRVDAPSILLGAQALLHASGATEAIIAIESDKAEAIGAMQAALEERSDRRLRLQVVTAIYPAGGERQLIQTLMGREVPSGGVPQDIAVLCQNVGTAAAIARLINLGEPLISRVVTIAGSGIREPQNLRARIGVSIAELIEHCGGYAHRPIRLLMGGTMMGVSLPDDSAVITPTTNCIVAIAHDDTAPRGLEMPCIRCGNCSDVCPANLLPQQLHRYAKLNDRTALDELGLRDCIECGCCDYVCPSQIPLTSTFAASKGMQY